MNSIMNFMPLTVVFFGWSFASGPVLYWATQSVFGAVQQYFITGWGALREWLPFLPEVVRYTPPDPDEIDESKVVASGEPRPAPKGFWALINRQMEKVDQQRAATTPPEPDEGKVVVKGSGTRSANGNGRQQQRVVLVSSPATRGRGRARNAHCRGGEPMGRSGFRMPRDHRRGGAPAVEAPRRFR